MALIQKFIYTWPEGDTRIEMHDWLKTLPQSDQNVYWEGRRNGDKLRQIAIDEGRMIMKEGATSGKIQNRLPLAKKMIPHGKNIGCDGRLKLAWYFQLI